MKVSNQEFKERAEGHTVKEIMDMFGISLSHVYLKARKLGVTLADKRIIWTGLYPHEEIMKYFRDHTTKECAKHFGISIVTARTFRKKYGVKRMSYIDLEAREHDEMILCLLEKYTISQIGRFLGISRQAVHQKVCRARKRNEREVKVQ